MGDGLLKPATNKDAWHRKIISKYDLDAVWPVFLENIPLFINSETKKFEFIELNSLTGGFIHPETDIEDNSLGIQPKTLVKYLNNHSIQELNKKLFSLNLLLHFNADLRNSFIDEGFINWNKVFKKVNIFDYIDDSFCNLDDDDYWIGLHYKNLDAANKSFDKYKILWKNEKGRVPLSKILQMINPKRFNKGSMVIISKLYGDSNLTNLSLFDHYSAVSLINLFGTNLQYVPLKYLTRFKLMKKIDKTIDMDEVKFKSIINVIEKMNLELNVYTLIPNILSLSNLQKSDIEYLSNLKDIHNLNTLLSIVSREDLDSDFKEFALNIPLRWYTYVEADCEGNRVLDINLIHVMYSEWMRRSEEQSILPKINKIGNYTYKVLDKTVDPDGLILGYATDCCQLFGMAGQSCLEDGFRNPSSTFVAVYKKNKVYAQSWLWSGIDDRGNKFACFDSIELLGRDLKANKDVIKCYKEIADRLIEEDGFKFVILGKDGNRPLGGIEDHVLDHKYSDNKEGIKYSGESSYTDTEEEGIYLIAGDWSK